MGQKITCGKKGAAYGPITKDSTIWIDKKMRKAASKGDSSWQQVAEFLSNLAVNVWKYIKEKEAEKKQETQEKLNSLQEDRKNESNLPEYSIDKGKNCGLIEQNFKGEYQAYICEICFGQDQIRLQLFHNLLHKD